MFRPSFVRCGDLILIRRKSDLSLICGDLSGSAFVHLEKRKMCRRIKEKFPTRARGEYMAERKSILQNFSKTLPDVRGAARVDFEEVWTIFQQWKAEIPTANSEFEEILGILARDPIIYNSEKFEGVDICKCMADRSVRVVTIF